MTQNSLSTQRRQILLLGATGLIGSALRAQFDSQVRIHTPRWSADPEAPELLARNLSTAANCDVILACGVTDPKTPEAELRYSNFLFPQRLIHACLPHPGVRFITLGTVMENFPEACAANPYLKSKYDLGSWMQSLASQTGNAGRLLHVRLHTVYGGARQLVKPHMFLGQMLHALEQNREFRMSAGDQLREYHHVDDIAASLRHLLDQPWQTLDATCIGMHSGNPVRLADLATAVFEAFQKRKLLHIGSIPRAPGENVGQSFQRSPTAILVASREPISGVVEWLKAVLGTPPH